MDKLTPEQIAFALTNELGVKLKIEALRLYAERSAGFGQIDHTRQQLEELNDPHVARLFGLDISGRDWEDVETIRQQNLLITELEKANKDLRSPAEPKVVINAIDRAGRECGITSEQAKVIAEKAMARNRLEGVWAGFDQGAKEAVKAPTIHKRPLVEFTFDRKLSKLAQHEAAEEEIRVAKAERKALEGGIMAITRGVCGG